MKTNSLLVLLLALLLSVSISPAVTHAEQLSIRIGVYTNAPKIFRDDNGHAAGFWPELLDVIAAKENWQIDYIWGTWNENLERLKSGEIDILPDVAVTASRQQLYDFSEETILLSWSRLYISQSSPNFISIFDLNGSKIAVLKGSVNYEGLDGIKDIAHGFDINCDFIEYESYPDVFNAVKTGQAYGGVTNRNFGDENEKSYNLKTTPLIFQPLNINFAFPKAAKLSAQLIPVIDKNIRLLKNDQDSAYYQSLQKYFEAGVAEKKIYLIPAWIKELLTILGITSIISVTAVLMFRLKLQKSRQKIEGKHAQLLEQESKYRILLDNQHDAAFLHKLNNAGGFSCFSEVNAYAIEFYGYSREEFFCLTPKDLVVQEEGAENTAETLRRKILASKQIIFESRHRKKSGEIFPVEVNATVFELQGECYILSVARDISERKQAEQEKITLQNQLQQSQKIESLGQLAGGVAHDFNNMLGVILGHAELALRKTDPAQPAVANLEEIRKAAVRSADLTRQLLTFARKQPIAPKVLDLNETVAGMLKMLQRLIGENIQLSWNPSANLWPVKVDASQIDQILANLCVNARDAITGGGQITIKTGNSCIDASYSASRPYLLPPGDYVQLSVSDDGCGMDKQVQDHIFEPFYTTKEVGSGTGLGLATVYGAVKQNNGFITLYSEPGYGALFNIYLPRAATPAAAAVPEPSVKPQHRGIETILLVEDDEMLLQLETAMLEECGYRVLAAATTDSAISLAQEHPGPIHLLISDMIMPVMNGRELSKKLQPLQPGMKVLFMSGYPASILSPQGVIEKGIHFLQKPFSFEALTCKVQELLDQR